LENTLTSYDAYSLVNVKNYWSEWERTWLRRAHVEARSRDGTGDASRLHIQVQNEDHRKYLLSRVIGALDLWRAEILHPSERTVKHFKAVQVFYYSALLILKGSQSGDKYQSILDTIRGSDAWAESERVRCFSRDRSVRWKERRRARQASPECRDKRKSRSKIINLQKKIRYWEAKPVVDLLQIQALRRELAELEARP
jgi:hypothetical protein